MTDSLRAATRGSPLALWQARHVAALIEAATGQRTEEVVVSTHGDRDLATPIHSMGGKGVFVKEVQAAVLDGRADIAVHSGKDLPALTPEGLIMAGVPDRADPRDALVGSTWADLPDGAHVATGSVRRRAQLAWLRPDLRFSELRGNIATRLDKLASGDFDAIVMAAAAIDRLELSLDVPVDRLPVDVMLPQVAQGALIVECRADDAATLATLTAIDDGPSRRLVDAERAFLAELGGDCDLPAGAYAVADGEAVTLTAMLSSLDGQQLLRETRSGSDPEPLGRGLARNLMDDLGGRDLLAAMR